MKNINPFIIGRYESDEYFCNRKNETNRLIDSAINQRNITLISPRRLGKTALIQHVFHKIGAEKDLSVVYLDLMHTADLKDFSESFAKAIIGKFDSKTTQIIKSISNAIKSLRPVISIDPITSQPQIEISFDPLVSNERRIEEIFEYIRNQNRQFFIAFDEFQQILNYPEKGVEAHLRSHIQLTNNANFIFAVSQKHLLLSMFSEQSRPFYQSTELMNLEKIGKDEYLEFIKELYLKHKQKIDNKSIELILQLSDLSTFHVQFLCNKIYGQLFKTITEKEVISVFINLLKENELIYFNYKNLLTANQFKLLQAIALEGKVVQITSKEFIQNHKLGAASSVKTALKALIAKEIIAEENNNYQVYDVFFAQWLKRF